MRVVKIAGKNIPERYPEGKIYLAQIGAFDSDEDDGATGSAQCPGITEDSAQFAPDFRTLVKFAELYLGLPVQNLGVFKTAIEGYFQIFHYFC